MTQALLLILVLAAPTWAAERVVSEAYTEPELEDFDYEHWSFVPVNRPAPPAVADAGWCRTPIDRFVLARIEAAGLVPAAAADRLVLLRRVTFDLTGLPPTPAALRALAADTAPGAYERAVDRLLGSPAYGERWAQHWLDLARFAETDGFEHDKPRPNAWRYRDWVIDALNDDVPYDEFVRLQLAGDELRPGDADALVATGFLVCGPDMPDINDQDERRHVFLNDMTGTVASVVMGLQFGCAQCHDHVTDPIRQADFYRLRAFLENASVFKDHPLPGGDEKARAVVDFGATPKPSHLWIRGDFRRKGPVVAPAYPGVLDANGSPVDATPTKSSSGRRTALARWLTRPEHPLTARVLVNRLWQHHFGRGLVDTTSDWGRMGTAPSHPELLDWLASEFVRREWSLKAMHRLLVTSAAYRTSSLGTDAHRTADPDNDLLARFRRRRLSGEEVRDAMLAASGRLNRRPGGPGFRPPLPPELVGTLLRNHWPVTPDVREHDRRSVYLFVRRNLPFPLFKSFDRPDTNASCPVRDVTTTAPQSLELLNSPFAHDVARSLATDLAGDAGWVDEAFLRTWGRPPTDEERRLAAEFVTDDESRIDFCRALLNANEAVFVD